MKQPLLEVEIPTIDLESTAAIRLINRAYVDGRDPSHAAAKIREDLRIFRTEIARRDFSPTQLYDMIRPHLISLEAPALDSEEGRTFCISALAIASLEEQRKTGEGIFAPLFKDGILLCPECNQIIYKYEIKDGLLKQAHCQQCGYTYPPPRPSTPLDRCPHCGKAL